MAHWLHVMSVCVFFLCIYTLASSLSLHVSDFFPVQTTHLSLLLSLSVYNALEAECIQFGSIGNQ